MGVNNGNPKHEAPQILAPALPQGSCAQPTQQATLWQNRASVEAPSAQWAPPAQTGLTPARMKYQHIILAENNQSRTGNDSVALAPALKSELQRSSNSLAPSTAPNKQNGTTFMQHSRTDAEAQQVRTCNSMNPSQDIKFTSQ